MSQALVDAVRGLHVADPDLGLKPLLAKLREQQPDLGACTKEVREALTALKAEESEAAKAAAAQPVADEGAQPAADEGDLPAAADEGGAPPNVAVSLACVGCGRLPSEMDDEREKHPLCRKCRKLKLPTTYWCCVNCPGNPGASQLHVAYHKEEKRERVRREDGGAAQQRTRETAERQARDAAQTGDKYMELIAEGIQYVSNQDLRRAGRAFREAIALKPDEPVAYFNLGNALNDSGHWVEAAQRYLEAKERHPVGSEHWAQATAAAFDMLRKEECGEVAKPEWWNDEELKALSARVVRAAPNNEPANQMRAEVLRGCGGAWEAGPRSAAELREAAAYYERAAALCTAPAMKAELAGFAGRCRSEVAIPTKLEVASVLGATVPALAWLRFMLHITAAAALIGRAALPQPLHPLTLAALGDWPEPTGSLYKGDVRATLRVSDPGASKVDAVIWWRRRDAHPELTRPCS
eukprot:scaffold23416_cov51-Phaeocystis_antarctica.AAC.1